MAHVLGRGPGVLRVQRVQTVPGCSAVPGQVRDVPGRGGVVLGGGVVLRRQVRAVRVVVRVVQALVVGVAGDDARRRGRRGGGRGGRGQVGVGHMVRAAMERQGGRAEGRVQGLAWAVGAPEASEQSVVHPKLSQQREAKNAPKTDSPHKAGVNQN